MSEEEMRLWNLFATLYQHGEYTGLGNIPNTIQVEYTKDGEEEERAYEIHIRQIGGPRD